MSAVESRHAVTAPAALAAALRTPQASDRVHMLGIGGVGMAGLALLLKSNGWEVSGCDAVAGGLLPWLADQGIRATVGHDPAHLDPAPTFLVRSPAVGWSEPELAAAVQRGIPVIDRGRLLPELLKRRRTIAVAGTHGKTTTSSMVAWGLVDSGQPASYCIGGTCPGLGAVARVERDGWTVVEADESDGTLRYYHPDIAVITSIDLDHVDYFEDDAALFALFETFAAQARHRVVPHGCALRTAGMPGRTLTFGLEPDASVRADEVRLLPDRTSFQVHVQGAPWGRVELPVPGLHNVLNALAALAAASLAGQDLATVSAALARFSLPRRRFEEVARGQGIRVISDYAHHPVEIAALIGQARLAAPRRIVAVFQPHRYSRTKAFLGAFIDVLSGLDVVVLAPVYAASEPWIEGGTSDDLYAEARRRGLEHIENARSLEEAAARLRASWRSGDLVLIIGAGDVEQIGTMAGRWLAE